MPDLPPDVQGEDGGGGVEDGGEGRHECAEHDGQHDAAEAGRHEVDDQQRVGDVGAPGATSAHPLTHLRVRARYLVWAPHMTGLALLADMANTQV